MRTGYAYLHMDRFIGKQLIVCIKHTPVRRTSVIGSTSSWRRIMIQIIPICLQLFFFYQIYIHFHLYIYVSRKVLSIEDKSTINKEDIHVFIQGGVKWPRVSPTRVNPNHTTKIWVAKLPGEAFQIHTLYIIQIVLDQPNFLTEYGACVQKNITNKIIPVRNQFSC